jgi:hypothetical protein
VITTASTRRVSSVSVQKRRPVEQRQPLAWIEDERNACRGKLRGVVDHSLAPVRRDDAEAHTVDGIDPVQVRGVHRPRMERGDLVVVEIGGDVGLRGVAVGHAGDVAPVDAAAIEPVCVGSKVLTDGRHRQRPATQQVQAVGDVAGAATELPAHLGHVERDVQDVHLVRENVVLEPVLEDHDGVVGNRAADQRGQGVSPG